MQREANRIYGFTAQQTLNFLQSLYEKGLVSYPRTDSQYITSDMEDTVKQIINVVINVVPFVKEINITENINTGRLVNDSKVTDHYAVIPTEKIIKFNLSSLPKEESDILSIVSMKLLCAVSDKHIFETVTAKLECESYEFTAKGKSIIQNGWKAIENTFKSKIKPDKENKNDKENRTLPELTSGQRFDNVCSVVSEHYTSPPKHFTEDTLLSAMETAGVEDTDKDTEKKGLGTPATRAGIIEKLIAGKFVERNKKQLIPTEKGLNLIDILPENIKSPKLTAEWENSLNMISKGDITADEFMDGIKSFTKKLIEENHTVSDEAKSRFARVKEEIGKCPRCKSSVYQGKTNFYCSNKDCGFAMWKNDKFFVSKKKELTKDIAAKLLKKGKATMKGLYSEKKNSNYDAVVILDDTGKYVNYKMEFPSSKK